MLFNIYIINRNTSENAHHHYKEFYKMADTLYGVTKVAGFTTTAVETLGSRQEIIVIQTNVDIRTATQGGGTPTSQANLDKLVQIVSERGQPVILGSVGTGPTSTYALVVFNEHNQAWGSVSGASAGTPETFVSGGKQLTDRIVADGVNYGFPADQSGTHLIVTFFYDLNDVVQFFS